MPYDSRVTYSEACVQTAVLCLECMKDFSLIIKTGILGYADSGTRTNIVFFLRRLLLARVQLPGLRKEICR